MTVDRPWVKRLRVAAYALAAAWIILATVFYLARFWAAFYRDNAGRLASLLDRLW